MAEVVLYVKNMSCPHCVMRIKKAIESLGAKADISLEEKRVVVSYDESKIKVEDLVNAISKLGYEVSDKP